MVNPFEIFLIMERDRKERYEKLSPLEKFWDRNSFTIKLIVFIGIFLVIFVGLGIAIDHFLIK